MVAFPVAAEYQRVIGKYEKVPCKRQRLGKYFQNHLLRHLVLFSRTLRPCTQKDIIVLKNITLSADIELIAQARAKAQARNATLNDEFRSWLTSYVNSQPPQQAFRELMRSLSGVKPKQKFSRDAANER